MDCSRFDNYRKTTSIRRLVSLIWSRKNLIEKKDTKIIYAKASEK